MSFFRLLWLGVLVGLLGAWPRSARACSVAPPPEPFAPGDSGNSVAPNLEGAQLLIRRAKDPGAKGTSDCSDLGSFRVVVEASDDQTEAQNLGYELTLVRGSLPFDLPKGPIIDSFSRKAGELSMMTGDSGDAYDATVAITVMDSAGNSSDPIEVHVSDDAVGCGCAIGRERPSTSAWLGAGATLLLLGRRRLAKPKP